MADVSNLDKDHKPLARDDRRRLFNLGNQLWHSDSSFRADPGELIRCCRDASWWTRAATPSLPTCAPPMMRWMTRRKAEVEDLVCEHSLIYSRGTLGSPSSPTRRREAFKPVRQRLVRTHPVTGRKSLYLSSHIGTIVGWPMPEARAFIRDLTEHAAQPRFVYSHKWRQSTW